MLMLGYLEGGCLVDDGAPEVLPALQDPVRECPVLALRYLIRKF